MWIYIKGVNMFGKNKQEKNVKSTTSKASSATKSSNMTSGSRSTKSCGGKCKNVSNNSKTNKACHPTRGANNKTTKSCS